MRVKDVMTPKVICIDADEPILKAVRLMLQNHISGLPVLDKEGELVGIVTEGDFLRRGELGTQRQRPKWLEFILGPGKLAQEYVQAWGGKIREINILLGMERTKMKDPGKGLVWWLRACRLSRI